MLDKGPLNVCVCVCVCTYTRVDYRALAAPDETLKTIAAVSQMHSSLA